MSENVVITSPFTGGKVREVFKQETMSFRGENYLVHSKYYVCEDTGQEFTTTEQDDSTLNDLYAQYRIKHGIPFPDEIASIRKRYGLNQSQIGKLLGFGVNQWARYEGGQVPSESNGRLSRMSSEPFSGLFRSVRIRMFFRTGILLCTVEPAGPLKMVSGCSVTGRWRRW